MHIHDLRAATTSGIVAGAAFTLTQIALKLLFGIGGGPLVAIAGGVTFTLGWIGVRSLSRHPSGDQHDA